MDSKFHPRSASVAIALMVLTLLTWPASSLGKLRGQSATVAGDARAAQVTVLGILGNLGTTTALADTGTLAGTNDARDASLDTGSASSLLTGEVLSAATISWTDEGNSQASITNLGITVGGVVISADSVIAQAAQLLGAAGNGIAFIDGLAVNGVPIEVTGQPNQMVAIPGGQLVINEQTISSTGTAVVNGLHATIDGVADVVIASVTAGIS